MTARFTTIRTEGGLLPPALLERVAAGDTTLPGLRPDDYHLAPTERFGEVINRSWNQLTGAWAAFNTALKSVAKSDAATGLTRERWLLLLFSELGFGRLQPATATQLDGKTYPISHYWGANPIHLVGAGVDLDHRAAGVAGAARSSPHSLVQEFLNRSPDHLWGFVANGLSLRIVRDNAALTRQAYVEFDLEALFDGQVYADFAVLWLLAHQSRVEGADPTDCWLERWSREARIAGARALDHLRDGVQEAIEALGTGFLTHRGNGQLRLDLAAGRTRPKDLYRELLRVVYRIIFLLVAEERDLLLDPDADPEPRRRYEAFYSLRRIRDLAERRRGTAHGDLWTQIRLVVAALGGDGEPAIALPALGSSLFDPSSTPNVTLAELANTDFLAAIRVLSGRTDERRGYRWRVDYRNLGTEELGSVYESLLELHPDIEAGRRFLLTSGGTERKASGSHYTPPGVLKQVLDFALEPAITRAQSAADPEAALLDLRILDMAAGSGHFLTAAAHRVAKAVASARTGELEPTPAQLRPALRDVVAKCIYGVDYNAMAVELCKVALWLEALQPGKPLGFLDHHIRVGNSLLGVPLATTVSRNRTDVAHRRKTVDDEIGEVQAALRVTRGDDAAELTARLKQLRKSQADAVYDSWPDAVPDEAFAPVGDDDRTISRKAVSLSRQERTSGQLALGAFVTQLPDDLVGEFQKLSAGAESTAAEAANRAQRFDDVLRRNEYCHVLALADTWCAAWFWPHEPTGAPPPTQARFAVLASSPGSLPLDMAETVKAIAENRRFFHFELAFPEVFTPERNGFDVICGNPPYLQGMKISPAFGAHVLRFLKGNHPAATGGRVDLAAYFLRRGVDLLRDDGDLGLVTTNSIAEGDTLGAGLTPVTEHWGVTLANALNSLPWEGQAIVRVAVVHLHKGAWAGERTLDGHVVASISPSLSAGPTGIALPLATNSGLMFMGSNTLGAGFELTVEAASRLITDDPRNVEVVRPLYGAEDLTKYPDDQPRRYIIDFGERSLDDAAMFTEPMEIVRRLVKPTREALDDEGNFKIKEARTRRNWWKFARRANELYALLEKKQPSRVIAIPEVSKTMLPGLLPGRAVYLKTIFVIASDDADLFGLLTSSFHWLWAARPGHATTMRVDPRYHQERCFETFPRPPMTPEVARTARSLDEHRSNMMRARNRGLTKIYNLVWDAADLAEDVVELRSLHQTLDQSVAAAYGWHDLDVALGFHPSERFGVRWLPHPNVQREIERRLLVLNIEHAGR